MTHALRRRQPARPPGIASDQPFDDEVVIADDPSPGVNLVGHLRGELGLGEVARKLAAALDLTDIPHSTIPYGRTVSRQLHPQGEEAPGSALYDTNIVCLNANQLRPFAEDVGVSFFARRYSIGVWFWEATRLHRSWLHGFHYVDEIWVASEFVRDAVAVETWKPVRVLPLPLEAPQAPILSRADLRLPEGFLFLFSFDFQSVYERKNPLGVVEAFKEAFAPGEGPALVLKSINGYRKPGTLERLQRAVADRPDIRVIDGYLPADQKNALMASCDCYVSLHRSEGLGLTMAEAMSYGKPVIATGYSGNTEFMDTENSYLVPYQLSRIPPDSAYPADADWADPDTHEASRLMRRVYEHPAEARARGARGRESIRSRFAVERTATFVADRLSEIRRRRAARWDTFDDDLKLAIMRVATEVSKGVGGSLDDRHARRTPTALVRRVLLRALWPYLAEQHRLNAAVLDALSVLQRARAEEPQSLAQLDAPSQDDGVAAQERQPRSSASVH